MNVARGVARNLLLPLGMILLGILLWMDLIDRTVGMVIVIVMLVLLSFRAGRLSKEIW
jgi:hypothetical protein